MTTVQGWRLVKRPDYSSVAPEVEGAVLTPPGASVAEPCWVWSTYSHLATQSCFSGLRGPLGDGYDHWAAKPLLAVEWDDGDVLETVAIDGGHRYLVAACEVLDPEFTIQEAAGLAVQAPASPPPHTTQKFPLWHAG